MKVIECDFCGAKSWEGPPYPDAFHDIFHLTGWPCVLCTNCMDKEFGTSNKEALLELIHQSALKKLGVEKLQRLNTMVGGEEE